MNAMVNTAVLLQPRHLPKIAAVAAGAALLAGIGLVKADQYLGTAHLSPQGIAAAHQPKPITTKELAAAAPSEEALPPGTPRTEPSAGASFAPAFEAEGTAKAPSPAPAQADAATETLVIHRTLPITEPIKYGQWFWNEQGAPAGPIIITVDLDARVLSVFRAGYEIGTTAVLLGTQEKPTPLGVFPITQKDAHHMSNLYDAPMPYMMRLTNDGVSIHATHVQNGYASHGCVGVPLDFAQKVFGVTKLGDKVFITRSGKTKV
jgi:lipoprotein-anchoring transpeptidase ErfK/SrfK